MGGAFLARADDPAVQLAQRLAATEATTLVAWHSHSPSVLTLNPGSGLAAVAADPDQIVHVYASFIGINSQPVRIVVQ